MIKKKQKAYRSISRTEDETARVAAKPEYEDLKAQYEDALEHPEILRYLKSLSIFAKGVMFAEMTRRVHGSESELTTNLRLGLTSSDAARITREDGEGEGPCGEGEGPWRGQRMPY